jgi:hypothetical protein
MLAGYRFEIVELAIRGSKLRIEAARPGPSPQMEGPVTIFGEDGQGFGQADRPVSLPPASSSELAVLGLDISIDTLMVIAR